MTLPTLTLVLSSLWTAPQQLPPSLPPSSPPALGSSGSAGGGGFRPVSPAPASGGTPTASPGLPPAVAPATTPAPSTPAPSASSGGSLGTPPATTPAPAALTLPTTPSTNPTTAPAALPPATPLNSSTTPPPAPRTTAPAIHGGNGSPPALPGATPPSSTPPALTPSNSTSSALTPAAPAPAPRLAPPSSTNPPTSASPSENRASLNSALGASATPATNSPAPGSLPAATPSLGAASQDRPQGTPALPTLRATTSPAPPSSLTRPNESSSPSASPSTGTPNSDRFQPRTPSSIPNQPAAPNTTSSPFPNSSSSGGIRIPPSATEPSTNTPDNTRSVTGPPSLNPTPLSRNIPPSNLETTPRNAGPGLGATDRSANSLATTPPRSATEPPAVDVSIARQLIAESSNLAQQVATDVQPLALVDVVTRAPDPELRKAAIQRYWQLSAAALDLAHAKREVNELASLPAPAERSQQAELAAAQAIARARVGEAELALRTLQAELEQSVDGDWQLNAPIPVDVPFIGRYRTNLETSAATDRIPITLRRIDRSLPWILETLIARSEAIDALQFQLSETQQGYRSGRVPLRDLLAQHERLRDQRLAFLAGVRDYNQMIADYALSVAPPNLSPEAVVGMLVREPSPAVARALPGRNPTPRASASGDAWRSMPR